MHMIFKNLLIWGCVTLFQLGSVVNLEAQDDQEWEAEKQRRIDEMDRRQEEFDAEIERRRSEEGERFDEEGVKWQRRMMKSRRELEMRWIRLDEEQHKAWDDLHKQELEGSDIDSAREALERSFEEEHRKIDESHQALDEEERQYWEGQAAGNE